MLIEFRTANHRSVRDEQVLSMTASSIEAQDYRPREAGYSKPLLPVAAIYGANASGKSNVLSAMSFMRDAVVTSQRTWSPDDGVPRDPFAWGSHSTQPSLFEATFLSGGVRYQYGFAVDDAVVVEEWLKAWPNGHKLDLLYRQGNEFEFGASLAGDNDVIKEATRPNALFLSTAIQLQHKQLYPIYSWFRNVITSASSRQGTRYRSAEWSSEVMLAQLIESQASDEGQKQLFRDADADLYGKFKDLMRHADLGVVDFRATRSQESDRLSGRGTRVQLRHQAEFEDAWLPLEEESRGTKTLYRLALPLLRAIDEGGVLLVDELESSLHPKIAEEIVRQFNSPEANPNNAQLVFTTHDTNLLGTLTGEPVVRRDEVWLTEKNPQGGTELYSLMDFKPRKSENLERGYMQGRYSAIPFLSKFSINPEP